MNSYKERMLCNYAAMRNKKPERSVALTASCRTGIYQRNRKGDLLMVLELDLGSDPSFNMSLCQTWHGNSNYAMWDYTTSCDIKNVDKQILFPAHYCFFLLHLNNNINHDLDTTSKHCLNRMWWGGSGKPSSHTTKQRRMTAHKCFEQRVERVMDSSI